MVWAWEVCWARGKCRDLGVGDVVTVSEHNVALQITPGKKKCSKAA